MAIGDFKKPETPDPEYHIRVMIEHKSMGHTIMALVPGIFEQSTDNKYDFNRYLNKYLDELKSRGSEFVKIHWPGDEQYEKYRRRPK